MRRTLIMAIMVVASVNLFMDRAHALPSYGGNCASCHVVTGNAGPDQTLNAGTTGALSGSGTTKPSGAGGTISTYAWSQTAGPAVTLTGATTAKASFAAPSVAASTPLTFSLLVTDARGFSGTDTCIVTVNPGAPTNLPPVAQAGPDQSVASATPVTLSGANSTDPEKTTLSYTWKQTGGTPTATLTGAATSVAKFTAPTVTSATALTFTLTVTDGGGLKATDTCIVNVSAPAAPVPVNRAPVANAGPDQTVAAAADVTISGSGSSDPDNDTLTYLWKQNSGTPVTLSSTSVAGPTFKAPSSATVASLVFTLTVTDGGGLKSTDSCTVNVKATAPTPVNQQPSANAGSDGTATTGMVVTLDGSGSIDADDGLASYSWTQTGGPAVTLSDPSSMSPTFTAPSVTGSTTLTFELKVSDYAGLSDSDTCIVNVSPYGSDVVAPVANAGLDRKVRPKARVRLNGRKSIDPDGAIASANWAQISGSPIQLKRSNRLRPNFRAPAQPDTLIFRLTVTDRDNLSSTDDVVVEVAREDDHED